MADQAQKNLNSRNLFLNKYFNLILSIILLFFITFSFLLFILPKYNSTKLIIQSNIESQKMLYAQQKNKLDTLRVISELHSKIPASDLQKFNGVLPSEYRPETLFGEFEEIISQGGWSLDAVSWIDLNEKDGEVIPGMEADLSTFPSGSMNPVVGRLEVSLSLSNLDYVGIKRLINILENNLRLFDVVSLDFSGESSAEIVLHTYYYEK